MDPLISTMLRAVALHAKSEYERFESYKELHPVCMDVLGRHGRDSDLAEQALELLAETAAWGTRRDNFRGCYIRDRDGWMLLKNKSTPHDIPYGYW